MSEPMHAARRRRERGAAAVLTVRPVQRQAAADRRRAMAAHPAGRAILAAPAPAPTTSDPWALDAAIR